MHEYITSHFAEDVNLNLIAGEFGYSQGYLTRIFQAKYGQSPNQYLIRLRINRARTLLEDQKLSIRQVGEAVGYPDQAYFSRIFKRYMGVSPQKYRGGAMIYILYKSVTCQRRTTHPKGAQCRLWLRV